MGNKGENEWVVLLSKSNKIRHKFNKSFQTLLKIFHNLSIISQNHYTKKQPFFYPKIQSVEWWLYIGMKHIFHCSTPSKNKKQRKLKN